MSSAVQPCASRASTSAPRWTSSRITRRWPSVDAQWSGNIATLSEDATSNGAPASSSARKISMLPTFAAQCVTVCPPSSISCKASERAASRFSSSLVTVEPRPIFTAVLSFISGAGGRAAGASSPPSALVSFIITPGPGGTSSAELARSQHSMRESAISPAHKMVWKK